MKTKDCCWYLNYQKPRQLLLESVRLALKVSQFVRHLPGRLMPHSSSRTSYMSYSLVLFSPERVIESYGRGMRKNLRGVSSADDDEERYSDEEEQEEEPAPNSQAKNEKRKASSAPRFRMMHHHLR